MEYETEIIFENMQNLVTYQGYTLDEKLEFKTILEVYKKDKSFIVTGTREIGEKKDFIVVVFLTKKSNIHKNFTSFIKTLKPNTKCYKILESDNTIFDTGSNIIVIFINKKRLLFNFPTHCLFVKSKVISKETDIAFKQFLEFNNLSVKMLGMIRQKDTMVVWSGGYVGEILQIFIPSYTCGEIIDYRVIIN